MKKKDIVIDVFEPERANIEFPIICVYDRPDDYPEKIVARVWDLDRPTSMVMIADSIEDMRLRKPSSMIVIPRDPEDARIIVETWV